MMKYREEYRQYLIAKLELFKVRVMENINSKSLGWSSSSAYFSDGVMTGILDTKLHSFEEDDNDPKALYGTLRDVQTDLSIGLIKYGEIPAMSYEEFISTQRENELNKLGI